MQGPAGKVVFVTLLLMLLPRLAAPLVLYLKESVTIPGSRLTVGDVADVYNNNPVELNEIRDKEIPFDNQRLSLIPAERLRQVLAAPGGDSLVIIGKQTAIIPAQLAGGCPQFYRHLARFLTTQGSVNEDRLDIEVLSPAAVPRTCEGLVFHFTLLEHSLQNGELSGKTRLYFDDNQGHSGFMSLDILKPAPGNPDPYQSVQEIWPGRPDSVQYTYTEIVPAYSKPEVKQKLVQAGEKINLIFIKGAVRLQLQGLAFVSGSAGDMVSVKPSTTNKRFDGVVTGEKEVTVEIL